MVDKDNITRIRAALEGHVGYKVKLTENKGRRRTLVRHGVIESAYPCIFTVKLDKEGRTRDISDGRMTFSYTDLLTKTVQLVVYDNEKAKEQRERADKEEANK